ncbi:MAG: SDR family NAD(P)-dependent oxidoreductase, partial [Chloroflexi bacterium]|nr:SDR family NAD(P)-dependent oxidoreductase [Chloroflexota bacterium]
MLFKEFSLEGKVAIVTGAGRGIGKAVALTLAEAGADVVVAARTVAEIEQTAQEARRTGRKALAIPVDMSKGEAIQAMVDKTIQQFGKIDILVNNAGAVLIKPIVPAPGQKAIGADPKTDLSTPISEEEWRRVVDLNLTALFLCCGAVAPHMIKQGHGKIINITSGYATKVAAHRGPYGASKAAVAMLTKNMALEWARYNINVNAVGPGLIRTEQSEGFFEDENLLQAIVKSLPLRKVGEARDIGLL